MRAVIVGLAVLIAAAIGFAFFLQGSMTGSGPAFAGDRVQLGANCSFPRKGAPGADQLALLIGVSTYKLDEIPKLPGTANDVAAIKEMLADPSGPHRFATDNVCLLKDSDATVENVLAAFNSFLVQRIDAQDHVLIYFAGHGGQIDDLDGQENDRLDETLVLYDSASIAAGEQGAAKVVPHLRDDVFGQLLEMVNSRLQDRAAIQPRHALTVILDSCNSFSATRNFGRERFLPRNVVARTPDGAPASFGDIEPYLTRAGLQDVAERLAGADSGEEELADLAPPGAVVMTAAEDGYSAFEKEDRGLFTTALVQELANAVEPLTYRQLEWRVRAALRSELQIPSFHGMLDALFLSSDARGSGAPHRVVRVDGGSVELAGAPIFGVGPGAEFRIFPGNSGAATEPSGAIAIVSIGNQDPVRPEGKITEIEQGRSVKIGDFAVLIAPSPEARRLSVLLDASLEPAVVSAITDSHRRSEDARRSVALLEDPGDGADFSVRPVGGQLAVVDAAGKVRKRWSNSSASYDGIVGTLAGLARQKSIRGLRGEGSEDIQDNHTLRVSLKPVLKSGASFCDDLIKPFGVVSEVREQQFEVPLCSRFRIQVDSVGLDRSLQIGVLILSPDGEIFAIPGKGESDVVLSPQQPSWTFEGRRNDPDWNVFQGLPPLGLEEEVLVFGVDAKTPVPWWSLADSGTAAQAAEDAQNTRGAGDGASRLTREFERYLRQGTRSGRISSALAPPPNWIMSRATFETIANPDFVAAATSGPPGRREYTIPSFDISPYLPNDTRSALYRVLDRANYLATKSKEFIPTNASGAEDAGQGFPYRQHNWCKADAAGNIDYDANLAEGIDCSRSIWYAFTQAGLKYSTSSTPASRKACVPYGQAENDYLATEQMASPSSPLTANFSSCLGEPLQIGDVLVYRDEDRKMGHTILVIDPEKRIAWGSHGWDGNEKRTGISDTGVEYQKIKIKTDWEKWDSAGMKLKACWRHDAFVEEFGSNRIQPWTLGIALDEAISCKKPFDRFGRPGCIAVELRL